MPSSFSNNLKLELIQQGEQENVWGDTTNTNFGTALEQAIVGRAIITFPTDADYTLPYVSSNGAQNARCVYLIAQGTISASRNLIVPTIFKNYVVKNDTTGGQEIVVKTSAGTGVTVPNGKTVSVYVDNTNVIQEFDWVENLESSNVNITGGTITGISTLAASGANSDITSLDALDAGTAAAPSISPSGDSNTGIYFPAADMVGFSEGGAGYRVGYRNVPVSGAAKTTSYTLATTDVGSYVEVGSGGSITIPDATFSAGDIVSVYNNTAGNITITCSITTAYIAGINTNKASITVSTRGIATVLFISSTSCVVTGTVL